MPRKPNAIGAICYTLKSSLWRSLKPYPKYRGFFPIFFDASPASGSCMVDAHSKDRELFTCLSSLIRDRDPGSHGRRKLAMHENVAIQISDSFLYLFLWIYLQKVTVRLQVQVAGARTYLGAAFRWGLGDRSISVSVPNLLT